MEKGRIKCMISGLNRYELTLLEERFIETAKHHLEERGRLTEQQETMLENLYMEKTRWIRNGMAHLLKNSTHSVA